MRDRLIELLSDCQHEYDIEVISARAENRPFKRENAFYADYLLTNGVVASPVAIGQTLFAFEDIGIQTLPEIVPVEVRTFNVTVSAEDTYTSVACVTKSRIIHIFKDGDFGKTVFFTREEAEQALQRGGE